MTCTCGGNPATYCSACTQQQMTDFWGEPISVYSDAQAVEDGNLVDLPAIGCTVSFYGKPINRMTRHLYDSLQSFVPVTETVGRFLSDTLRAKLSYACDTARPGEERGVIFSIPLNLWLVANEVGGFTAMYPEDY